MKFRVTMKTPDALEEAITDAAGCQPTPEAQSGEDVYCQQSHAVLDAQKLCSKWFRSGEYLTVEIDTEVKTCTVVENV